MPRASAKQVGSCCTVLALCAAAIGGCVPARVQSTSTLMSPEVMDRVGLCGGGLKEEIGPALRFAVARDVATSGKLSLSVEKAVRAAIIAKAAKEDIPYVYGQYTACVTNRAENDQYISTLKARRADFATALEAHGVSPDRRNTMLALADQEIASYRSQHFVEARNTRKRLINEMVFAITSDKSADWMINYTLSESRRRSQRRSSTVGRPTKSDPESKCRRLSGGDAYCNSAEFRKASEIADSNALIDQALGDGCGALVGPEAANCRIRKSLGLT